MWMMRQAGRYLPSYQALRRWNTLEKMFYSPALIEEVTCLPVDELGVDAAILFADILHVALPLGIEVGFPQQGGPVTYPKITCSRDIDSLQAQPVKETLSFVAEGIKRLKQRLTTPLIGFCGGPLTVAYFLTGKKVKRWIYADPDGLHTLLERITQATILYLKLQQEAGVDVFQVFESRADALSSEQFSLFAAPYLERIIRAAAPTPTILFCRGSSLFLDELIQLRPQALGLDALTCLPSVRAKVAPVVALQGNVDPELLHAPPPTITRQVTALLEQMADDPGFIVNLGHGILPDTPMENVHALLSAVKTFSL